MCKCLNCGKELEGNQRKYCSFSCENIHRGKEKKEEYNKAPNYCRCCGEPLPYEKRRNKYCSSSCSAKDNNGKRIVSEEQRNKTRKKLEIYYANKRYDESEELLFEYEKNLKCGRFEDSLVNPNDFGLIKLYSKDLEKLIDEIESD